MRYKISVILTLMELWNDDLLAQLEQETSEVKAAEASARQACIKAEVARREASRQKGPAAHWRWSTGRTGNQYRFEQLGLDRGNRRAG